MPKDKYIGFQGYFCSKCGKAATRVPKTFLTDKWYGAAFCDEHDEKSKEVFVDEEKEKAKAPSAVSSEEAERLYQEGYAKGFGDGRFERGKIDGYNAGRQPNKGVEK